MIAFFLYKLSYSYEIWVTGKYSPFWQADEASTRLGAKQRAARGRKNKSLQMGSCRWHTSCSAKILEKQHWRLLEDPKIDHFWQIRLQTICPCSGDERSWRNSKLSKLPNQAATKLKVAALLLDDDFPEKNLTSEVSTKKIIDKHCCTRFFL